LVTCPWPSFKGLRTAWPGTALRPFDTADFQRLVAAVLDGGLILPDGSRFVPRRHEVRDLPEKLFLA
jgi:hypothetical protein